MKFQKLRSLYQEKGKFDLYNHLLFYWPLQLAVFKKVINIDSNPLPGEQG